MAFIVVLVLSIFLQGALGHEVICEDLSVEVCSFSVASSGKRCYLEIETSSEGNVAYHCMTSDVVVKNMPDWIESEECVKACGVDRFTVGISSDSLLDPHFTLNLCSPQCYHTCPNIVDLYYNLALAEGVLLPEFCKDQRLNPRRSMSEFLSSGAASGPVSAAAAGGASSPIACSPISI